ncbi:ubiquinol oxidase subunit II [Xaviernesmea oryzae]|uniref:Ubiquinol oxidase polypeptide II n=1 Tax=Xaviernesmea oryzae TaxID=464029 RepID=A0A1Q9B243_9HYPH|nr:ubiquinol oxidase subunit II [Xaviernesmea oryzae]OLP62090.1 ubiquinol oxidase subunit II [Xaviernesmea oryzae]SEL87038.1 cytochrome o ubiquinol oxidase subunit 2 [Xaviernesmea oryzae]
MMKPVKFPRSLLLLPLLGMLAGCNMVVMSPFGDIAAQQRDLIVISTLLMLLIIIPVICLTLFFAWRYRAANTAATYDPEWHHSTRLEVVIWAAPLAIIIALGAITWISTHKLDPYRPLDRIDAQRPLPADVKPLTVQVVALDWKWLFIYPEQGLATVNELYAPVDVPINFEITASSVMNSFYIPALAGQVYAMPGMRTKLHAVINQAGAYNGFSANYSGAGFSHMTFTFNGTSQADFDAWVAKTKAGNTTFDRAAYLEFEKPSEREPKRQFANVEDNLFDAIVNLCVKPGQMCAKDMMHIDMMGGAGKESHENREKLRYDTRHADEGAGTNAATFPAHGNDARSPESPNQEQPHAAPAENGMQGHDMGNMGGQDTHGNPAPEGEGGIAPKQLNQAN